MNLKMSCACGASFDGEGRVSYTSSLELQAEQWRKDHALCAGKKLAREQVEALTRFEATAPHKARSTADGPLLWRDEVLALFEKSAAVWRSAQQ